LLISVSIENVRWLPLLKLLPLLLLLLLELVLRRIVVGPGVLLVDNVLRPLLRLLPVRRTGAVVVVVVLDGHRARERQQARGQNAATENGGHRTIV